MKLQSHFPPFSLSPKDSVDPSLYVHVDQALKRLKLVMRHLISTWTTFEEESRLLDRLFYKGKNQHRASLFWRHAEGMRRFCSRLHRSDLPEMVNRIRHAFFDSTNYQKCHQTALKSAWTHVPHANDLTRTIQSIMPTRQLLLKMSERLMRAYCVLKRAMQAGAFLQLILTLSAIACRLRFLSQTLLQVHEEITTTLTDLRNSLEVRHKLLPSYETTQDFQPTVPAIEPQDSSLPHCSKDTLTSAEPRLLRELLDVEDRPLPVPESTSNMSEDNLEKPPKSDLTLESRSRVTKVETAVNDPLQNAREAVDVAAETIVKSKSRKKKKKPTDEIDAIFGF